MNRPAAIVATLLACAAAGAQAGGLGIDADLGLLSFSDVVLTNGRLDGSLAVGGNARISGYSIAGDDVVAGDLVFASGSIAGTTVVGGRLTSSYSGSFGGDVAVGGALDARAGLSVNGRATVWGGTSGVQPWYPAVTAGSGPFMLGFDFIAAQAQLSALSTRLDGTPAGAAQLQYGTLHFDASGQTLAVFDIDAADAARNMQIDGLAAGAAVVINVHGGSVDFGNHGYTGFGSGQVLFNLPEATQVGFHGGTTASLLAPLATVQAGSGVIHGQVVAAAWTGSAQIDAVAFEGVLPAAPVPEPRSWALALAGLLAVGTITRRRA